MNLISIDEQKTSALIIALLLFGVIMAYLALAGRAIPEGLVSTEHLLVITIGGVNVLNKRGIKNETDSN